jgi:hypothetical protein
MFLFSNSENLENKRCGDRERKGIMSFFNFLQLSKKKNKSEKEFNLKRKSLYKETKTALLFFFCC